MEDEIFLSWFTRLAKENCSDVDLLFQRLLPKLREKNVDTKIENLETNTKLKSELIGNLESYIGMPISITKKISFKVSTQYNEWDFLNKPSSDVKYCAFCILDDSQPYFRYYWQLKFITFCLNHKCLLFDKCPHCLQPIQYWRTNWNEKLTICFSCKEEITQITFVTRHEKPEELIFQKHLIEIYDKKQFLDKKVDSDWFFRQLWKIVIFENEENRSKFFNEINSIPFEGIFKGISRAFTIILNDEERLERPYICYLDDEKFLTMNSLRKHNSLNHINEKLNEIDFNMLKTPEDIAKAKFNIIQPLLDLQTRTKKDVQKVAGTRGTSTIYRWIERYEQDGIYALAPKKYLCGRPRGFPSDVEQMISDLAKVGFPKNTTMKVEWRKFQQTCLEIGFLKSEIPGYQTFMKRIKEASLKI